MAHVIQAGKRDPSAKLFRYDTTEVTIDIKYFPAFINSGQQIVPLS